MTDEELATIEGRANAATPGPWNCRGSYSRRSTIFITAGPSEPNGEEIPATADKMDDADFIAHARQDVPALIAEVRRLRDEAAAAEADRAWREGWKY